MYIVYLDYHIILNYQQDLKINISVQSKLGTKLKQP